MTTPPHLDSSSAGHNQSTPQLPVQPPQTKHKTTIIVGGCCLLIAVVTALTLGIGVWLLAINKNTEANEQATSEISVSASTAGPSHTAGPSASTEPGNALTNTSDAEASPDLSVPPAPIGTTPVDAQRLSFTLPIRWQEQDLSNHTRLMPGYEVYEYRNWQWLQNPGDPMPREIFVYTHYGQGAKASSSKADPVLIETAMQKGVDALTDASESQLLEILSSDGHGCFSNAAYLDKPQKVERNGTHGIEFTFECVGSITGQLGIKGVYGIYMDQYGDFHQLMMTTDHQNFDANKQHFTAILESVKQK